MQRVDQGDDFGALEEVRVRVWAAGVQEYSIINTSHQDGTNAGGREMWGGKAGRGEENVLECFLVEFEEDLERRRDTRRLYFTPKPTLIAPDTIHNPCHVPEMRLELFFQDLHRTHPSTTN